MSRTQGSRVRHVAGKVRRQLSGDAPPEPVTISLVVPLYKVEAYLPDLLNSLTKQSNGAYRAEVIFVDDGSPDRSAELVRNWITANRRTDLSGRLLQQANAGVAAARNAGIEAAQGDWIGFPDSDDYLHRDYLKATSAFLASGRGTRPVLVATNIHKYLEEDDLVVDNHSLRFKFKGKAKNVDLNASPHYIQMAVNSAFFRRSDLANPSLRFTVGLHASEDALFVSEVLRAAPSPIIGIVPGAIYYYRKRASRDSAVDLYNARIETYFERFEEGYLPLLRRAADPETGLVPDWLANQVLYELRWIFGKELDPQTKSALGPSDQQRFLANAAEMLSHVSDQAILGYRVTTLPNLIRALWLELKGTPRPEPRVFITRLDPARHELQLRYLCAESAPQEEFRVRAQVVTPQHVKTSTEDLFGRTIHERVVWLPATGWLSVKLDGQVQELGLGEPGRKPFALTEVDIWRYFGAPDVAGRPYPVRPGDAASAALSRRTRRRYAGSWILTDAPDHAGGPAEDFYRWLRRNHPEVGVWFALKPNVPDWVRLKKAGFHLLDADAAEFDEALLVASALICSNANQRLLDSVRQASKKDGNTLRFVRLPGTGPVLTSVAEAVRAGLDLWCVPDEEAAAALAADGTPTTLTSREVVITGRPESDTALASVFEAVSELRRPIQPV